MKFSRLLAISVLLFTSLGVSQTKKVYQDFTVNSTYFGTKTPVTNLLNSNEVFLIIQPKTNYMSKIKVTMEFPPNVNFYNVKYKLNTKEGGILPWQHIENLNEGVKNNRLVIKKEVATKSSPLLVRFYLVPVALGKGKIHATVEYEINGVKKSKKFSSGLITTREIPSKENMEITGFVVKQNANTIELYPKIKVNYNFDGEQYSHKGVLLNSSNVNYNYSFDGISSTFDSPYLEIEPGSSQKYEFSNGSEYSNSNRTFDLSGNEVMIPGRIKSQTTKPQPSTTPIIAPKSSWQFISELFIGVKIMPSLMIMFPKNNSYNYSLNLSGNFYDYVPNNGTFGFHVGSANIYTNFKNDFGIFYSPGVFLRFFGNAMETGANINLGYLHKEELSSFASMFEVNTKYYITKKFSLGLKVNYQLIPSISNSKNDGKYNGLFFFVGYKFL